MKNDVCDTVFILEGKLVIDSRWLYKVMHAIVGSIKKFKAPFVVIGFSRNKEVDYEKLFALVAKNISIKF